jgi:hypothetical protein
MLDVENIPYLHGKTVMENNIPYHFLIIYMNIFSCDMEKSMVFYIITFVRALRSETFKCSRQYLPWPTNSIKVKVLLADMGFMGNSSAEGQ